MTRGPAGESAATVAIDLQALQPGVLGGGYDTGADGTPEAVTARVTGLAAALARSGRLVAGLLSPDRPAPPSDRFDPDGWCATWDGMGPVRRLIEEHPGLVRLVPAPFLLVGGGPAGSVVSRHWAATGAPRIVTVERAALERAAGGVSGAAGGVAGAAGGVSGAAGGGPGIALRLRARAQWVEQSELVVRLDGPGAGSAGTDDDVAHWDAVVAEMLDFLDRRSAASVPSARPPRRRLALVGPFPPGGGGIGAYNGRLAAALGAVSEVDAVAPVRTPWRAPSGAHKVHIESFGTDLAPASYDAVVYTLGNSAGHLPTVEAALRHPGWLWLHEAQLPAVATSALESVPDAEFAERMAWLLERAYPGRPPLAAARSAGRSHIALAAAGVGLTAPLVEAATGVLVNSGAARRALEMDQRPLAWRPPVVVLPPACPAPRDRGDGATGGDGDDPVAVAFGVVSMAKRPDLLVDAAAMGRFRLAFVGPCPDVLRLVIQDRAAARGIAGRVEISGAVDDDQWWQWMDRAAVAVQLRDSASGEMSAAVLDALAAGVAVVTNLASARDYPEGTVRQLDGLDAAEVAAAVDDLLSNPAARRDLAAAGRHFAVTHQMSDLASALLAAVSG